jgi:hypothetical protein
MGAFPVFIECIGPINANYNIKFKVYMKENKTLKFALNNKFRRDNLIFAPHAFFRAFFVLIFIFLILKRSLKIKKYRFFYERRLFSTTIVVLMLLCPQPCTHTLTSTPYMCPRVLGTFIARQGFSASLHKLHLAKTSLTYNFQVCLWFSLYIYTCKVCICWILYR